MTKIDYHKNPNMVTLKKDTRCPSCGFTILRGGNLFKNRQGDFVCVVCILAEQAEEIEKIKDRLRRMERPSG